MDFLISAWPFFVFIGIGAITPGPNNLMLAASGMNYGYRRTVPHMLGIGIGFCSLLLLCMLGAGAVFEAFPVLKLVMKVIATVFMVYLAYKIAMAGRVELDEDKSKPLTFLQAAAFQYVNPKSWVVGLLAVATLLPDGVSTAEKSVIIVITVLITASVSVNVWALSGKAMARLFTKRQYRKIINAILALLLLATIPMIVM